MNILTQLFDNFSTFSLYAPGVETNMNLNDLNASSLTARKRIEAIISSSVFTAILKEDTNSPLFEALRSAMANITMATQLVFDSINRRKNDINVYKYELEAMRRAYMENYCNALDTILQLLINTKVPEGNTTSPAALWTKSRYFEILQNCEIKTMPDFDMLYPIDASYLFFFRTLPLQRETLDEVMSVYFSKLTTANSSRLRPILLLALVKKTVAKSLRRFDILEFPVTIRNLFEDNKAFRHGTTEADNCLKLADHLDREAAELIGTADTLLSTDTTPDVSSYSAYNNPSDNIIMLP